MNEQSIQRLAILVWVAAFLTAGAALFAWLQDPGPAPAPAMEGGGAFAPTGDPPANWDMNTSIACPPVPGRPTLAALDAAIENGTRAFLELYVRPSLENAAAGGYLDLARPGGGTERRGPDVYAQCQLYLMVHLLMYADELGVPRDDPLVVGVHDWLLGTQDEDGGWLWSEEGCLHAKAMIALGTSGDREAFEAAWRWAREAPFHLRRRHLFSMAQSGHIVQTLGSPLRSLSGEMGWEHGGPEPDEENTVKYLYALLNAGAPADDPEVVALREALSDWISGEQMPIGPMQTHHLVGRLWDILCHTRFRLPPDDGFVMSLAVMRAAARGEWRRNFMMRAVPLFRGLLVRALVSAGDRSPEIDALVHSFVECQEEDGAWRLPHTYALWGMDAPPKRGYKFGNFDGANTYMLTLALIEYRGRMLGG